MRVLILSRAPNIYSTRRLASVMRRRGHNVEILDPLSLSFSVREGELRLYEDEWEIERPDVVLPRIGASATFYGLAIVRQLEMMGVAVCNEADAIERSRDKLRCLQVLTAKGIPTPDTAFSRQSDLSAAAVEDLGDGALVVKLLQGTQGKGVMLAHDRDAARSILDAFQQLDAPVLLQRFIRESAGRDVRAFVVGRDVVAVMERKAKDGESRSNLHRGGKAREIPLSRSIQRAAIRATRALGLDVAGVDLLLSEDGPLVIEVNSCPGLEGIERTTGVNVAGAVVDHLESLVEPAVRRRRRTPSRA